MGYVRANYGCKCYYGDSAYKRFNRYNNGGGDINIFYNYGNQCCGGHSKVGFWGGLGAGLGMGLGNLFCGIIGGMGNMFGFGGFGGFGNFGNFGGGFGNFGNFGFGGASSWMGLGGGNTTNTTNKQTNKQTNSDKTSTVEDKDTKQLADFNNEYTKFKAAILKDGLDKHKNELTNLKTRVKEKAENPIDGDDANKALNTTNYNGLLGTIEDLLDGKISGSKIAKKDGNDISVKLRDIVLNPNTDLSNLDQAIQEDPSLVTNLTKEDAAIALIKLGYADFDKGSHRYENSDDTSRNSYVGKQSAHYSILMLQKQAEICVETEHYTGNANVVDYYVTGKVTEITMKEDGSYSYTINCANTGHEQHRNKYVVTIPTNFDYSDGTELDVKMSSTNKGNTQGTKKWIYSGEKQFLEPKSEAKPTSTYQ